MEEWDERVAVVVVGNTCRAGSNVFENKVSTKASRGYRDLL